MFIESFVAFFLLLDLRKTLRNTSAFPEWDRNIKLALYLVAALFITEIFVQIEPVTMWIWHVILFAILGIIFLNQELATGRTIMLAVLPFAVISFLIHIFKLLTGDRFRGISGY